MATTYDQLLNQLKETGFEFANKSPKIQIQDAKRHLIAAATAICKQREQNFVWSEEYEPIAEWLSDNKGRGIFIQGTCGNGKTLMGDSIALVLYGHHKVITEKSAAASVTTTKRIQEICNAKYAFIDDIGTETDISDYGNKKTFVAELLDAVERKGSIAILTTNIDSTTLKQRYGDRTLDRIKGNCKIVVFKGETHRKQ